MIHPETWAIYAELHLELHSQCGWDWVWLWVRPVLSLPLCLWPDPDPVGSHLQMAMAVYAVRWCTLCGVGLAPSAWLITCVCVSVHTTSLCYWSLAECGPGAYWACSSPPVSAIKGHTWFPGCSDLKDRFLCFFVCVELQPWTRRTCYRSEGCTWSLMYLICHRNRSTLSPWVSGMSLPSRSLCILQGATSQHASGRLNTGRDV